MAKAPIAQRDNPVAGNKFANSSVSIEAAPAAARVNLRATQKGAQDYGKSLGFDLPSEPGRSASKSGVSALWIGPDEWLVNSEKVALE